MAVNVSTSDSVIDKKHESFSLLPLCDVVSLSQLVTCYQHSHHIQADMDGGFGGIWGSFGTCAALWGGRSVEPLWAEEMIQMQSFWLS